MARHVSGPDKVAEQKKTEQYLGEDRISELPEDILLAIVSLLPSPEAGRTSVLSRQWRHIWTFITCSLNFHTWKSFADVGGSHSPIADYTYVSRVNKALQLHQGEFVDEFVIGFSLKWALSCEVDKWVNFAFQKRVKRFELDLARNARSPTPWYDFPMVEKFWPSSKTVQGLQPNGHATRTVRPPGFGSLVTLCLRDVNITGDVIEHFLGNCPFLEELQVIGSARLRELKVAGPSLKLKRLELSNCSRLIFLEIYATNLVALTLNWLRRTLRMTLLLKNVPVLSEYCTVSAAVIYNSGSQLVDRRQLKCLKLILPHYVVERYDMFPKTFPDLHCLKRLELEFSDALGENLIFYTSLIKACPSLSRYTMRYTLARTDGLHGELRRATSDEVRDARAAAQCQHRCLKVVELVGFTGRASEFELVSHLLEIAVALDEMILNPHNPMFFSDSLREDEEARERIWKQLATKTLPKAKIVVL